MPTHNKKIGVDLDDCFVTRVCKNTPAHNAGLLVNDFILSINGHSVTSKGQILSHISEGKNHAVTLIVKRENRHFFAALGRVNLVPKGTELPLKTTTLESL